MFDEPTTSQITSSITFESECKVLNIPAINNIKGRSFMQFRSFGEQQSDMNSVIVYSITTNLSNTISVGANLCKNIMKMIHFSSIVKRLFGSNKEFENRKV